LNNTGDAVLPALAADDAEAVLAAADEEAVDALEAEVVGEKTLLPGMKPTSDAKLPPTEIESLVFFAATTR
jgi:hypothetical protein